MVSKYLLNIAHVPNSALSTRIPRSAKQVWASPHGTSHQSWSETLQRMEAPWVQGSLPSGAATPGPRAVLDTGGCPVSAEGWTSGINHYKCKSLAEETAVCQIYKIQTYVDTPKHTQWVSNRATSKVVFKVRPAGWWDSARWKEWSRKVVQAEGQSNVCKCSEVRQVRHLWGTDRRQVWVRVGEARATPDEFAKLAGPWRPCQRTRRSREELWTLFDRHRKPLKGDEWRAKTRMLKGLL